MRKYGIGLFFIIGAVLIWYLWNQQQTQKQTLAEISAIETKVENVGKLIVSEGHYSDIYNFKDSKAIFGEYFQARKKALVVVRSEVLMVYDLHQLEYALDTANKIIQIQKIPVLEMKLHPDFEYYDISQDYFNSFSEKDYNYIKESATELLKRKVRLSKQYKNAPNRLISELTQLFVLSKSQGWALQYAEGIEATDSIFQGGN
ncbi:MAG: DUF4230 domain-containing protein [Flavobacteriaceae bacterium]|nr:DUF4230 domain-containing protein [Flavobacteriaceae bacterium]